MIKKNFGYIVLMTILMVVKPSFSMHQLIFRGAKLVGKGTLPVLGGALSYHQIKKHNQFSKDMDEAGSNPKVMADVINNAPIIRGLQVFDDFPPKAVEELLRNRWMKIGHPLVQTMPIVVTKTSGIPAVAICNKAVGIGYDEVNTLNDALLGKIDNSKEVIAGQKMISLHEIFHIINNDSKNRFYALGIAPIAVEAMSSGVTYGFNKICHIEVPKTWLKTVARSSLAVGSIVPKLCFNLFAVCSYHKYGEFCADRFACENAETREELIAFRDEFRKYQHDFEQEYQFQKDTNFRLEYTKVDPAHPYLGDRADMVQKYIDKWDAEHKEA